MTNKGSIAWTVILVFFITYVQLITICIPPENTTKDIYSNRRMKLFIIIVYMLISCAYLWNVLLMNVGNRWIYNIIFVFGNMGLHLILRLL